MAKAITVGSIAFIVYVLLAFGIFFMHSYNTSQYYRERVISRFPETFKTPRSPAVENLADTLGKSLNRPQNPNDFSPPAGVQDFKEKLNPVVTFEHLNKGVWMKQAPDKFITGTNARLIGFSGLLIIAVGLGMLYVFLPFQWYYSLLICAVGVLLFAFVVNTNNTLGMVAFTVIILAVGVMFGYSLMQIIIAANLAIYDHNSGESNYYDRL